MKTLSSHLFVIAVFFIASMTAQESNVWFDANWNETTKDKAVYYRPTPKKQDDGYWIVDYYINGTVQMKGLSKNNKVNKEIFYGLVRYYFDSGVLHQEVNYVEGKIQGDRKIFYPSGKLHIQRDYQNGKPEGQHSEYYDTGELKERGMYENGLKEGVWKVFYKNGKIKEKKKFAKGNKTGIWKIFYNYQ